MIIIFYCISILLLNLYWADWHLRFRRWYNFTYTLIEYSTFTYLLFINIHSRVAKLSILVASLLFVGFLYFFNFVYHHRFDSIPIGAETVLLLIVSIYFFYEQFKDPSLLYIYTHYCFWITIGILVYLCGSFFIFLRADSMTDEEQKQFWFLTYVFEIVKNMLFAIAIIVLWRKSTENKEHKKVPFLDMDISELYNK